MLRHLSRSRKRTLRGSTTIVAERLIATAFGGLFSLSALSLSCFYAIIARLHDVGNLDSGICPSRGTGKPFPDDLSASDNRIPAYTTPFREALGHLICSAVVLDVLFAREAINL